MARLNRFPRTEYEWANLPSSLFVRAFGRLLTYSVRARAYGTFSKPNLVAIPTAKLV